MEERAIHRHALSFFHECMCEINSSEYQNEERTLLLMNRMIAVAFLMTVASVSPSFAAHPLLTDDTRSQGRGGFQIEVNSELTYDEENDEGITTKETGGKVSSILSYGITENVDIVIGVHYQWFRVKEDGSVVAREDGISDVSLEMK